MVIEYCQKIIKSKFKGKTQVYESQSRTIFLNTVTPSEGSFYENSQFQVSFLAAASMCDAF